MRSVLGSGPADQSSQASKPPFQESCGVSTAHEGGPPEPRQHPDWRNKDGPRQAARRPRPGEATPVGGAVRLPMGPGPLRRRPVPPGLRIAQELAARRDRPVWRPGFRAYSYTAPACRRSLFTPERLWPCHCKPPSAIWCLQPLGRPPQGQLETGTAHVLEGPMTHNQALGSRR